MKAGPAPYGAGLEFFLIVVYNILLVRGGDGMNWTKAVIFGFILFAVMFLLASVAMFGLKLSGIAFTISMLVSVIIVVLALAIAYGEETLDDGFRLGLVMFSVNAILEYLVVVRIFNKGNLSFYSWSIFLGYALIILLPGLVGRFHKKS